MILSFVRALISAFKARRELALENVALRQQLAVLHRSVKRPRRTRLCLLFIHPPAHGSEVSPAARNTLDSARIPRASKLLIVVYWCLPFRVTHVERTALLTAAQLVTRPLEQS